MADMNNLQCADHGKSLINRLPLHLAVRYRTARQRDAATIEKAGMAEKPYLQIVLALARIAASEDAAQQ
jgi:hypothetical protein